MNKHSEFMREAIAIAKEGMGKTGKNPSVGAVLVHNNQIIAKARTANDGRPHAEEKVLQGNIPQGSVLYITLEPCIGNKKPCTDLIIAKGIKKVIIGCLDPNPLVNGKGIEALRENGVEVSCGTLQEEAQEIIKGFNKRISTGMPWVTLKIAMSLDGKIALKNGKSKWITNEEQLQKSHLLRSNHDAILVGIGTVLADDPLLTCRHPEFSNDGLHRIILDSELKTPLNSRVVTTSDSYKTTIFTASKAHNNLKSCEIMQVEKWESRVLNLKEVLNKLGEMGINSVLVEGGGNVFRSFFFNNLFDELKIFYGKKFLGNDAIPLIDNLGLIDLPEEIKNKVEVL